MDVYRHGDVLISPVEEIPDHAVKQPDLVLARGEVTGHAHRVETDGMAELYEHETVLYLRIVEPPAEHRNVTYVVVRLGFILDLAEREQSLVITPLPRINESQVAPRSRVPGIELNRLLEGGDRSLVVSAQVTRVSEVVVQGRGLRSEPEGVLIVSLRLPVIALHIVHNAQGIVCANRPRVRPDRKIGGRRQDNRSQSGVRGQHVEREPGLGGGVGV